MRLIHTADWQLGKPFGRFPQEVRTALGEARFDAIDRIGALARERDAVHVVVAGDVFDSTGPADREVVQAVTRMGRAPCTWWLLPGNHDHARSDGLWSRVRHAAPGNVRVMDTPEPVEIEGGAWLLPAPLEHRRTREDPTSAFDGMATPDGSLRIGLAHGSVVDFGARGEADNMIPPDRAQRSGLDYLALGDWHGFMPIGERAAYSGTPEVDRFGRDEPGGVILADVRRGATPVIERVETGRYRWLERSWALAGLDDFERELRDLRASVDQASTLVRLVLSGTLSLADRVAVGRTCSDDLSHALRWLDVDDTGVTAQPTEDDIAAIDIQGALATATLLLKARVDAGGADHPIAAAALERLYVEAIRATEGAR
jgi:DNA repair exonuclease SbcCD nuclease subunit